MEQRRNRVPGNRRGDTRGLAQLATEQGGPVSLRQLEDNGISRFAASRGNDRGTLHRVHRGVYTVGHRTVSRTARLRAALLACGEGAVVSHGTAAAFWNLWDTWPRLIDVTVPEQCGRKIDEIRCRRCRYPNPEEIVVEDGVVCTTPARVFVDLAGSVGIATLRRTVGRAGVLKILDVEAVDLAIHQARGRRGLPLLQAVLAPWRREDGQSNDVRSDFEALALPRLLSLGAQRPGCNVPMELEGRRIVVDFVWERERLVVETDGRQTHETPLSFQSDRLRDQFLVAAGYRVQRVTWDQMRAEFDGVVTRIARALDLTAPANRVVR